MDWGCCAGLIMVVWVGCLVGGFAILVLFGWLVGCWCFGLFVVYVYCVSNARVTALVCWFRCFGLSLVFGGIAAVLVLSVWLILLLVVSGGFAVMWFDCTMGLGGLVLCF